MAKLLRIQVFRRETLRVLMTGSQKRLLPKKNQHQMLQKQMASKRLQRLMTSQKQTPQKRSRPLRTDNRRMINQQKRHLKERVLSSEESNKSY